ncbi:MAG: hypothetical protein FJ100_24100 [Deltaproteobacteria bacterium]|nr:hypothetical protein [Deltaproteobacteria bacterium]
MADALQFDGLHVLGPARMRRVRALWRLVLWRRVPEALVGLVGDAVNSPLLAGRRSPPSGWKRSGRTTCGSG